MRQGILRVDTLTPQDFVRKWQPVKLKERSASQPHFVDLCRLVGVPSPIEEDPTGESYAFERGVTKMFGSKRGRRGWADVWKRGCFAWEYKSPKKSLEEAYDQLLLYREALENPPLLVVSDIRTIRVHTNFNNSVKRDEIFTLKDLLEPKKLDRLRTVWTKPELFHPHETPEAVTRKAAEEFAGLAESLRRRGENPERAARFLIRLLFCLFAEDIGLLPDGLFTQVVERGVRRPESFGVNISGLFAAMAEGGEFLLQDIQRFNGGLFAHTDVVPLDRGELRVLLEAARLDWGSVEPAVLGTLFERSLDPAKRAQLGAHYTSKEDILAVVEPVLMAPLRRRWESVREQAAELAARRDGARGGKRTRLNNELVRLLGDFTDEIAGVNVLDPACGSGNFLYVSLKRLLDLEKEVVAFARDAAGLDPSLPKVKPDQMHGLEIDEYARELAAATVWIGHIQWLRENGFGRPDEPILGKMQNVAHMDAVLARGADGNWAEPDWPEADAVVGNPPFLGGKRLRAELDDGYVDELFAVYDGRVPREADLVCYWFEKAREQVASGRAKRAGLLATNSIRGGANRRVLQRVRETGGVFFAESDRPWVLNGAAVRVSMVGFDDGSEGEKVLDGAPVEEINADLTGSLDLTAAARLPENLGIAFMGDTKGGPFDVPPDVAKAMLSAKGNPNGRPNSDVVRPWANGLDITRRPRGFHIVDFGTEMGLEDASLYEVPFEYVNEHVRPIRATNRRKAYRDLWWLHVEPRPAMRRDLKGLPRFVSTPTIAKHRLFVWLDGRTLPDHQIIAFARDDDYFFGVLHSRAHELWSLRTGTSLEDRPRYTPTTCFETFPLPWPPGEEPAGDPRVEAVAAATRVLDERRRAWLDPEGASEADLKKRTLTALYNARPTWLARAQEALDRAVYAAYGWPEDLPDEEVLKNLLALNAERAGYEQATS